MLNLFSMSLVNWASGGMKQSGDRQNTEKRNAVSTVGNWRRQDIFREV